MGDKIFLSYRREDASADARSIYQHQRGTFGKDQLFIDVDTIEKGRDFRQILERNLKECRVLIAVIGKNWLSVKEPNNNRRIDDENDFVRLEISKALAKDVVVIPVLVGNASLPKPEQIPEDIRGLVFRQGALVRHESFHQDMEALERDIKRHVKVKQRVPLVSVAAVLVTLGLSIIYAFWRPTLESLFAGIPLLDANFARDRDIASVMARCVKYPEHPEKQEIAQNIAARLTNQPYEYGWTIKGGRANDTASPISWQRITSVSAIVGELKIYYDWRDGRLRLVPVIRRESATRGLRTKSAGQSGLGDAAVLQGAWSQNNGYGCIEMIFDDDGNARTRWGVATSDDYDAEAVLRKKP